MNVLITGCSGFLGKEFYEYFKSKYTLLCCTKEDLDISNEYKVKKFFNKNNIDVILHTAYRGGKRFQVDTFSDFVKNLNGFENLRKYKPKDSLMFCFGSGACYDRSLPISGVPESFIELRNPKDLYGLSKNLISRNIKLEDNIIDLILFGCFGKYEEETRFIKSCLRGSIEINKNMVMDLFYVKDLCKIIDYYIVNYKKLNLPSRVNMSYIEKYSLKEIASLILPKSKITIKNSEYGYYNGSGGLLESLGVKLLGLKRGLKDII